MDDPYQQMNYCIEVWNKAVDKASRTNTSIGLTFNAYYFRHNAQKKLIFE